MMLRKTELIISPKRTILYTGRSTGRSSRKGLQEPWAAEALSGEQSRTYGDALQRLCRYTDAVRKRERRRKEEKMDGGREGMRRRGGLACEPV